LISQRDLIMLSRLSKQSRRDLVTSQYAGADAAIEYDAAVWSSRPTGRFQRARLRLVGEILAQCPGGELLDAGCGPGILTRALLDSRPGDFRISVLDQSPVMVRYCASRAGNLGAVVGRIEAIPCDGSRFDVTLALGVLEYVEKRGAIAEISRVTRPGGLVVVSMLNPRSPYRIVEWTIYRALIRALNLLEAARGVPSERRHSARASGIRAVPAGVLQRLMREAGLEPVDVVYFDVTALVPPLDRLGAAGRRVNRTTYEQKVARGWRRFLGTGYVVVARRTVPASGRSASRGGAPRALSTYQQERSIKRALANAPHS
jgi:ubiquinone/menaquinone biosynthesis C-methylase UbiE